MNRYYSKHNCCTLNENIRFFLSHAIRAIHDKKRNHCLGNRKKIEEKLINLSENNFRFFEIYLIHSNNFWADLIPFASAKCQSVNT